MECLEEAKDKVRFGREKRSRVRDDEERRAVDVFVSAGLVSAREAVFARAMPQPWRGRAVG